MLTPAEWRVVDAVRHGFSNRQIASRRGISLDAVKFHVANIAGKLGIEGRAELKLWRGIPQHSALRRDMRMTTELSLGPIGQISRHTSDIKAAEAWYRDVLGLQHMYTFGKLAFFDCGGTRLFVSEPENGAKPGPESVLYFRVEDINAAFDQLKGRGVRFIDAPHMIFRHDSGMEEWMCFFKDPDGGILGIMSQVTP